MAHGERQVESGVPNMHRPVMGRRNPPENLASFVSTNPLANDSNLPKIRSAFALNVRKNPNWLFKPAC
jgi:hypothetical protein